MQQGVIYALLAAVTFGASTPISKLLLGSMSPWTLAAVLYLGSGLGLAAWLVLRRLARPASAQASLTRTDMPWLAGAVAFGGVAGPVLLMTGLAHTAASTASLLLNVEGVLTALLAWFAFRENFDRRIFAGMVLIVAGGVLLAWQPGSAFASSWGVPAIVAACLCWAIDNNLTRKISASDAVQIAAVKGLVAGAVNLVIALTTGQQLPALLPALGAAIVGFCGYGLSLVLFVLALRHLGTARTGAYFSAAPFVGAALSLLLLRETPAVSFWLAGALMAVGIWLHLTEHHEHEHTHEPLEHSHEHVHDEHHRHDHDFAWDGSEPHAHGHRHQPLRHVHPHTPDIHHRHEH